MWCQNGTAKQVQKGNVEEELTSWRLGWSVWEKGLGLVRSHHSWPDDPESDGKKQHIIL